MISQRQIDQAYSDLKSTCGGVREDYFGLLYLEKEHNVLRGKALNKTELLTRLPTARVRPLPSDLMHDRDFVQKVEEQNLGRRRTDRAFDKCMENAYKKWHWVHKKLT